MPTFGLKKYLDKTISWIGADQTFFNPSNNQSYITQGYKNNATVYSIINLITRNAIMIPFKVYEVKNKSALKSYNALTGGFATSGAMFKASTIKAQSFTEVTESDVLGILQNPNPMEGWSSFLSNYIGFGKLTGNRYIYGVKDGSGKIREMYILPSQHMEIVSGGQFEPVKGYNLSVSDTKQVDFKREEICHIKDFNPYFDFSGSHLYGQSPLEAAFRILETNNEVTNTSKKQLQNQASRGLLVAKEMDGIDEAQAKQLDAVLKKKMQDNRGGIAITNQPMEWVNFGLSPADMELLAQANATTKELCNVYGVPVALMNNTEGSSYNNVKEAKSFLFQNAVNPEMIKLRDELNSWLIPAFGENLYLDFDFTAIPELQEDVSEMVDQLDKAHYMKPNEKRKVLGMAEDTEDPLMDKYYFPVNLMPLENMDLMSLRSLEAAAESERTIDNNLKPENEDV